MVFQTAAAVWNVRTPRGMYDEVNVKGERIGQGRENAKQFLKENKDITAKIEAEVRRVLNIGGAGEKPQPVAVPTDGRTAPVPPVIAARAMGTMKK